MSSRLAAAILMSLLPAAPVSAQAVAGIDIEPYAGSQERPGDRIDEAFGQTRRVIGLADGRVIDEAFSGRILLRRFENPPDRSTLEIIANYRDALLARGLVVDWECTGRSACGNQADGGWRGRNGMNLGIGSDVRYLTGRMPVPGGTALVSVGVETRNHYVQILQADTMDDGQVAVTLAETMAQAIAAEGRIALDNILFDFGSAVLLPASDAPLEQIARLLNDRPDLSVYVVGHTDSIGTLEANLALSRARAQAVVDALVARFGVAAGRAVPAGVGPLAPLASNATEAGRAQNRRVEIVAR